MLIRFTIIAALAALLLGIWLTGLVYFFRSRDGRAKRRWFPRYIVATYSLVVACFVVAAAHPGAPVRAWYFVGGMALTLILIGYYILRQVNFCERCSTINLRAYPFSPLEYCASCGSPLTGSLQEAGNPLDLSKNEMAAGSRLAPTGQQTGQTAEPSAVNRAAALKRKWWPVLALSFVGLFGLYAIATSNRATIIPNTLAAIAMFAGTAWAVKREHFCDRCGRRVFGVILFSRAHYCPYCGSAVMQ